jgi:hypothetical protein
VLAPVDRAVVEGEVAVAERGARVVEELRGVPALHQAEDLLVPDDEERGADRIEREARDGGRRRDAGNGDVPDGGRERDGAR